MLVPYDSVENLMCAAPSSGVMVRMSRKGNCFDIAPVEASIIERFYNRQRLDQAMGYRSPEEFDHQESGA